MTKKIFADVLVVGAGPVGMTLAIDLGTRGLKVVVVERRAAAEPPSVKCNHVSARSMEIFRRLGLVQKIRESGLPADFPHDISYRTSATGIELTRIPIPCRRDRYSSLEGPDTWWPTPEPPHRINQIYLEPILFEHMRGMPNITVLNGHEVTQFSQDSDSVRASARNLKSDELVGIECEFLVGCDGGRSEIRRSIGGSLQGTPVVQRVQSTFIRAPDLASLMDYRLAWGTFSTNPRRSGVMYAIDGRELWLIHNYLRENEPSFDSVDRDVCIRDILGVGKDFTYEILSNEDWFGRRLVSDRFRDRRAFICGDAAHLWVPFAGYGMNAGIADATNLAFLLNARLEGWASESILNAYEMERQPITEQVSYFAMRHAEEMAKQRGAIPDEIEEPTERGAKARAEFGRILYDINVQQYCCAGLNFGYFYDKSPIICHEPGVSPPSYGMGTFQPSTVPGCRLPHFWLGKQESVYDSLGPVYTVIRSDPKLDTSRLLEAAVQASIPMKLVDADLREAQLPRDEYRALLICRSDQQIAWRGDAVPTDLHMLISTLQGKQVPQAARTKDQQLET